MICEENPRKKNFGQKTTELQKVKLLAKTIFMFTKKSIFRKKNEKWKNKSY